MSGLLRRLFSPRWRHPDPKVRRDAAERLDPHGQRDALETLVQDPEPEVRQAAVARLEDPQQLLALRARHGSRELDRQLISLLIGRQGGIELSQRQRLVDGLDDPQLLEQIALQGDNQQLRLSALARLDDEQALIRQACDNGIAAVRHAAAERVTSEEGLKQLVQAARRDRHVARNAKERLGRLRADADAVAEAKERREQLLQSLEQHARAAWEPLYAGRFRHLEREWLKLPDLPEDQQERRYQEACLRCRKVIHDHEAQEHALRADRQRREQADHDREALVMALEESLSALYQGDHVGEQDLASLRAQKQLLASRWQALSEIHLADDALRQRYDAALKTFDNINQAYQRLVERSPAMEEAIKSGDEATLRQLVEACRWPDNLPPEPRLARARHYLRLERDLAAPAPSAEQLARFAEELDRLDALLDEGSFKGASRLHQRLRHLAEALPASAESERSRLKRLGARLAELRDWRGFVAGPKREQLCQAIEALEQDSTLSDRDRDRRHRQLVKEWKALADAAANKEQSERFRAASDRIRESLAGWRQQQQQLREANLAERIALCDQLEALLAQPSHHADPDALRDIREHARDQWRRTAPVPRDQAEAIGRRFGRIRHQLQALIDRRANEIAESKRALIDQARSLLETSLAARQRGEQAKALQQRWRELGRAPKGEEQTLWREFRQLCDQIFAQRDAERDDRAQRAKDRLDRMQALIDRVDAWQPTTSEEADWLDKAVDEANALEPLPSGRRSEGMRKRWTGIVRARRERLERIAVAETVSRWHQLKPLILEHLKADDACLAGQQCGDVLIPDTLTLPNELATAHAERNAARRSPDSLDSVAERLARLRVHLALLAGQPIGQHDEPLRLAIQVDRLNDSLGQMPTREEELLSVLCGLLATGPVSRQLWDKEVQELDALLDGLRQLPPP
ncbi:MULTISPECIES: DUF349 domain-containing protein [unclassified Halomonas]|uniref:DUF349 domain-containing protein n=1 Tax=unclassified Halomonas TaxID=2609666 RepID=UPI001C979944|nr:MULTISPECIES: DUF349 domain-containing protein [unclassified Halomonas]MBY5926466.1 DUF349 domain-containing protein [Halomonas sp. DP4Y7-2]MBY6233508.1 DUF349 domain-containing protein [Halomonas sp. DP4Y7-1]